MSKPINIQSLVDYHHQLTGDEKGESQVFLDRLFQAFGHQGYKEAGATLEERIAKRGGGAKFADLLWRPRVLIEMKKRGENLEKHYRQAFDYWIQLVPNRPHYVILCNFDEFWIYDFNLQVDEPMDRVKIAELSRRWRALSFLSPVPIEPQFENNLVEVTRKSAKLVTDVFKSMIKRGENRATCQRFLMQMVIAMFAEDASLLPDGKFTELIKLCGSEKESTYDLLGGLFRQMNSPTPAKAGRYVGVPYFNGGLFATVEPIELSDFELLNLRKAATDDWRDVRPEIFGVLFQHSMGELDRHAKGAHFTSEADIQKIVTPTIVRPWQSRIDHASSADQLIKLLDELRNFKVLDPACGSGNFLYVAYREMKRLETQILSRLHEEFKTTAQQIGTQSRVSVKQLYGLDLDPFAVEIAKVTLMIAKELALLESGNLTGVQHDLEFDRENPLPLDNLDENIIACDALFTKWPEVDVIIGNPPFQSKNKMQQEFGPEYVQKVRAAYPEIPGRADFCVYWIRKAHDHLKPGQRAGLVGTNTIAQNFSREGGLDYVVNNGGTITEAVSSQIWSGDAVVYVAIVNWIKADEQGDKVLSYQTGNKPNEGWISFRLPRIASSLTASVDVTAAGKLPRNQKPKRCYQGQTHGCEGFLLNASGEELDFASLSQFTFPYLTFDELISNVKAQPHRLAIDAQHFDDVIELSTQKSLFAALKERVWPEIDKRVKAEKNAGIEHGPRSQHAERWWRYWRYRPELISELKTMRRYVVCGQVTKRPIFEFISTTIRPNAALMAFTFEDDYSFGILQSDYHWQWFQARCSTLKGDARYTSESVFDSFPWPQSPTDSEVVAVASAARELRHYRNEKLENGLTFRALYKSLETEGKNPLRELHSKLDDAVRQAYGFQNESILENLLTLNLELVQKSDCTAPGIPPYIQNTERFFEDDCIRFLGGRV